MNTIINISDLDSGNGKSYREINLEKEHKFKLGQLVELDNGIRLFVVKHTRDCDNTPLYSLGLKKGNSFMLNGYPCDSLKGVE